MESEATSRCENLACLCEVPIGDGTCSPFCASPAGRDPQNIICECGHPACAAANASQLRGEAGHESP